MKCQRCKEREANVHIVQQEAGKKPQTFMLCDVCAREMGISIPTIAVPVKINNPFAVMGNAFQTTLGIGSDDYQKKHALRCARCNLTFDEFRKTGFLGCPYCYESFGTQLDPVFCRTQMGKKHIGRKKGEKSGHIVRKQSDNPDHQAGEETFDKVMIPTKSVGEEEVTAHPIQPELMEMDRKHKAMLISKKTAELNEAVEREDYLSAARLRDEISVLKAREE
ncbi:MAG: hypothetical protein GXY43_08265 [Clostridiaceae bacterium]|jgi:protein arginine kinase activator|nr:hypothetical protein [Clostridiaceae bacterium]